MASSTPFAARNSHDIGPGGSNFLRSEDVPERLIHLVALSGLGLKIHLMRHHAVDTGTEPFRVHPRNTLFEPERRGDASWWAANPQARAPSDRLQTFLFGQGIHSFADQFTLSGKPFSTRHSTGMVATNAVGGQAATDGRVSRACVDELWNTPIPYSEQPYYDGLLYPMSLLHLMSLLHVSGEFRGWNPPP